MGRAVLLREAWQQWRFGQILGLQASAPRIRYVDPGVPVAFDARIGRRIDTCRIECVLAGERGDFAALSGAGLEGPPVVLACHPFTIEPAAGEWNAAVRTAIAHGEDGAVATPPQD